MKISVSNIIKDHLKTLVNANSNKTDWADWLIFLFVPLAGALILMIVDFRLSESAVETIVSGLSIFVGLLFNALIVLIDTQRKNATSVKRKVIIKEVTANVSFAIVLSFATIATMLFIFINNMDSFIYVLLTAITIAMLLEFFLVFLMIMKRTYLIFSTEPELNVTESPESLCNKKSGEIIELKNLHSKQGNE